MRPTPDTMDCEDDLLINGTSPFDVEVNFSFYMDFLDFNSSTHNRIMLHETIYGRLIDYINKLLMPVMMSLGVIGNIANLVVLGRKSFRRGLNLIERSALTGLITLSVSDTFFCLVGLPIAFLPVAPSAHNTLQVVGLYYGQYRIPLLNIFLFTSPWLIVWISMERYIAVCHPFQAKVAIKPRRSTAAHVTMFVLSVLINIPLFLQIDIRKLSCTESCVCYQYISMPHAVVSPVLMAAHRIAWVVLGTVLPMFLLSFCNINILYAVCRTDALGTSEGSSRTLKRVTVTLIVMVFMYLILVTPSMVMAFVKGFVNKSDSDYFKFQLFLAICNFGQAVKFSTNFLLYCVTNKQFRDDVSGTMCKTTSSRAITPESSTARRYQLVGTQLHTPQTAIHTIMQSK